MDDLTSEEEQVVDEFEDEQVDELDADEQLEEEAEETGSEQEPVADAEEAPDVKVPEHDPKDAVIGEMRRDRRELREQLAEQAKVIEGLKNPPPPPERSPLDKLAEEDPDGTPGTQTLLAQSKWEQKQREAASTQATEQADKATTQQATTTRDEAIAAGQLTAAETFSEAKVGKGVDFETVIAMGEKYLTEGEKLDIRTADAGKVWDTAYRICRRAVLQSGKPEAKTLRSRINAHKAAGGKDPKPKTTPPGGDPKVPGKVVVNEEGSFAHITSFLFDGD